MTDREPVNIMGVIAFPNPNKDERVIRFIDSEYHTLFTIKRIIMNWAIMWAASCSCGNMPALFPMR